MSEIGVSAQKKIIYSWALIPMNCLAYVIIHKGEPNTGRIQKVKEDKVMTLASCLVHYIPKREVLVNILEVLKGRLCKSRVITLR